MLITDKTVLSYFVGLSVAHGTTTDKTTPTPFRGWGFVGVSRAGCRDGGWSFVGPVGNREGGCHRMEVPQTQRGGVAIATRAGDFRRGRRLSKRGGQKPSGGVPEK